MGKGVGFIKLEWDVPKKGFKIEEHVSAPKRGGALLSGDKPSGTYLVPRGAELRSYSVDLLEEGIFLKLAGCAGSNDDMMEFVNQWGLPTRSSWTLGAVFKLAYNLTEAAVKADEKGISELAKDYPPDGRYGSIKWGFRSVRQSAPSICFFANDLRTFCWLELLQFCAGPTDIGQCPICKILLQRPKSGPLPQYCSQRCIQQAYRDREKAAGKKRTKRTKA